MVQDSKSDCVKMVEHNATFLSRIVTTYNANNDIASYFKWYFLMYAFGLLCGQHSPEV